MTVSESFFRRLVDAERGTTVTDREGNDVTLGCPVGSMSAYLQSGAPVTALGSGGSWSVAEHFAQDLTRACGISALMPTAAFITGSGNDGGYDDVWQAWLECVHGFVGTVFIISSSGETDAAVMACEYANQVGLNLVTLTGFKFGNRVNKMGDVNIWVPGETYGEVEMVHAGILHALTDALASQKKRSSLVKGSLLSRDTLSRDTLSRDTLPSPPPDGCAGEASGELSFEDPLWFVP